MIDRAKAALTSGGKIGAVLWYQGESDTVKHEDAYSYGARLKKLIIDLRVDLDLPNLLFIQVYYFFICLIISLKNNQFRISCNYS